MEDTANVLPQGDSFISCSPDFEENYTYTPTPSGIAQDRNKSQVIQLMQQRVSPGSPEPHEFQVLADLQQLTTELMQIYQADGALQEDPFAEVRDRTIHLYESSVRALLQNKTVLVTGGEGCVGNHLIAQLIRLGAGRVVSVDKAQCADQCVDLSESRLLRDETGLAYYAADLRNAVALEHIFSQEKPAIVFHLAAQRLPGVAEVQVHETVTSNIFGTRNLIQMCEAYGVEHCVFSSTGKASRYLTAEVYAASKKMAEWLFARAQATSKTRYSMVRFTHMLDNSHVCQQYEDRVQQNRVVNIHAPDRYVVAQTVQEAGHLLLNSLVLAEPDRLQFILCRNLGWPVETLAIALHKIHQSGKAIPIYFQGVLPGYEEAFFRGQVNWSQPHEINTLINVVESQFQTVDASQDLIVSVLPPFNLDLLETHLGILEALCSVPDLPKQQIKLALATAVRELTGSMFALTPPEVLLQILRWGVDAKALMFEGTSIHAHVEVVTLLLEGLQASLKRTQSDDDQFETVQEFYDWLEQQAAFDARNLLKELW